MCNADEYLTIASSSTGSYKEKGSKFIAFAYPVNNTVQVNDILSRLRTKYHDAHHCCYAYVLGLKRDKYRVNDDGEPVNTAGKPILSQINARKLTNVCVVVIRYFGGILLGKGGLARAYMQAADHALRNAPIIKKLQKEMYRVCFDLKDMNDVMKIIGNSSLEVISQKFEQIPEINIGIRTKDVPAIIKKFTMINGVEIKNLGIM